MCYPESRKYLSISLDRDLNRLLVCWLDRIIRSRGCVGGVLSVIYPGVLGVGGLRTGVWATSRSPGRSPGRGGPLRVHHPVPWGWGYSCLPVGDSHWNWWTGSFLVKDRKRSLQSVLDIHVKYSHFHSSAATK